MWSEMTHRVDIDLPLLAVTRTASASPATGSAASHRLEQSLLLDAAFDDLGPPRD
jgi:2-oxoglutarate dehydrogenase complex dehydrogenase (E1) component-like enzyme